MAGSMSVICMGRGRLVGGGPVFFRPLEVVSVTCLLMIEASSYSSSGGLSKLSVSCHLFVINSCCPPGVGAVIKAIVIRTSWYW